MRKTSPSSLRDATSLTEERPWQNRELPRLEKLAHSIDPTCFLIVSHVTEVSGRGFSMDKDYL